MGTDHAFVPSSFVSDVCRVCGGRRVAHSGEVVPIVTPPVGLAPGVYGDLAAICDAVPERYEPPLCRHHGGAHYEGACRESIEDWRRARMGEWR